MLIVDVCPSEWARKHHILVKTFTCPHCKLQIRTEIPYVTSKSYGLMTQEHRCAKTLKGLSYVPKSKEMNQLARSIAEGLV